MVRPAKDTPQRRAVAFIGSRVFFKLVLAAFILQAAWIAASGRYPMAFDEDFHLGIIRLYAHHLSPFWSAQPSDASAFGAVFRDPSYLYQYLMSFPYRFIGLFTDSQAVQVLFLRSIDIGLFTAGLVIYRRLLLRTKASSAIVNSIMLLFVLIPVVPLLGAQINYDNLFIPLTGLILLLALRFDDVLRVKKRIDAVTLGWILVLCLLASLVKYPFLPIFVAVAAYLAIRVRQAYRTFPGLKTGITEAARHTNRVAAVLLVAGLIVSGSLFLERYGVNIVRYHKPVPDCGEILSVEECSAYPPWLRDYNNQQLKDAHATKNPAVFAADWFYGMWLRLFFAVDGPATYFQTRGPLIVPGVAAIGFTGVGIVLAVRYGKALSRRYARPVLGLMLLVTGIYVMALWVDGYQTFVRTGQAAAINGRYLFPILPFFMLICALAFNEACGRRQNIKLALAAIALLCMVWGGGTLTYILRSSDAWYWRSTPLKRPNHAIRSDIGPLVPGYDQPTAFMGHN